MQSTDITAFLLNGTALANELKKTIKKQVLAIIQAGQRPPGLAVVLLGEDQASMICVQNKCKVCLEVGFNSYAYASPHKNQ